MAFSPRLPIAPSPHPPRLGFDVNDLIITFAIMLLAAVVKTIGGFGAALIISPVLSLVLGPTTAVPLISIHDIVVGGMLIWHVRRWIRPKEILPLLLGALVTIPVGTWILAVLDPESMKRLIGGLVVLMSIPLALGVKHTFRRDRLSGFLIGALSGLLGGSTGMSGPPVIFFFHVRDLGKETFRANLIFYFLVLYLAHIIALLANGLITRRVLSLSPVILPVILIAVPLGNWIFPRLKEDVFRKAIVVFLVLIGIYAVISTYL